MGWPRYLITLSPDLKTGGRGNGMPIPDDPTTTIFTVEMRTGTLY
jgi:hypothetical protein